MGRPAGDGDGSRAKPTDTAHDGRAGTLVIEGLGYLGGVIIVAAALVIGARYWDALGVTGRLSLTTAAAGALTVAGWAVPQRPRTGGRVRLRAAFWLAATAAVAATCALLWVEVLDFDPEHVAVVVAAATALVGGAFWYAHRTLIQQLAFMVALMATGSAAVADFFDPNHWPGVPIWLVGVGWYVLGVTGRINPQRAAVWLGSAGAVVGAAVTMAADAGIVFALVTAAAIVVLAVRGSDLPQLIIGALGVLLVVPVAVNEWFPSNLAVPLGLLIAGAVLVTIAVLALRRRRGREQ